MIRTIVPIAILATAASANIPQMGGPMSHLLVSIFNQQVFLSFESPSMSTVELLDGPGAYQGNASVLDHSGINSQFGWLVNGTVSLPSSSGVFVRTLGGSPHLSVYSEFGYAPILGTDGSDPVWQWDGTMTHNWYASEIKGLHSVRYEVYVGDLSGNPLDGWTGGGIELNFTYGPDLSDRIGVLGGGVVSAVPSPSSIALLGGLAFLSPRRRGR